jgi:integrase
MTTSTSLKGLRVQLAGLHKPHRRNRDGVTVHVYAWRGRGAPKLGEYKADTPAAAHAKAAADSRGIAERYAEKSMLAPSAKFVAGLILEYKASSDWKKLAPSTQVQWKSWLTRIDEVWGDQRVSSLAQHGARRKLIQWRDWYAENSGQRAADYGMQVMRRLLAFAVDREYLAKNPALGVSGVYSADRSDMIWSDEQIADAVAAAPRHIGEAIELAALTGLRVSDLVTLRWDEIAEKATSKSRGRTTAQIPLTPALEALLARIERKGDVILYTAKGAPWSCGNTLSKAIQVAAAAAGVELRTHDLRGTAATRYAVAGLTDEEIAAVMGWGAKDVARLRRIYVDKGAIARRVADKLAAFTSSESPHTEPRA